MQRNEITKKLSELEISGKDIGRITSSLTNVFDQFNLYMKRGKFLQLQKLAKSSWQLATDLPTAFCQLPTLLSDVTFRRAHFDKLSTAQCNAIYPVRSIISHFSMFEGHK